MKNLKLDLKVIMEEFLFQSISPELIQEMKHKLYSCLTQALEEECCGSDQNKLKVNVSMNEDTNKINFGPDNVYTLFLMSEGKAPPTMFMKDGGMGKNEFIFQGKRYYFEYNEENDTYKPIVEEID